jgi:hypothetical protein
MSELTARNMTDPAQRLAEDRAARDAARLNFQTNLARITSDLQAHGIGERISERALREVKDLGSKTVAIAAESKGIIAGTVAAIMLWLLRKPLFDLIEQALNEPDAADAGAVQVSDSEMPE